MKTSAFHNNEKHVRVFRLYQSRGARHFEKNWTSSPYLKSTFRDQSIFINMPEHVVLILTLRAPAEAISVLGGPLAKYFGCQKDMVFRVDC